MSVEKQTATAVRGSGSVLLPKNIENGHIKITPLPHGRKLDVRPVSGGPEGFVCFQFFQNGRPFTEDVEYEFSFEQPKELLGPNFKNAPRASNLFRVNVNPENVVLEFGYVPTYVAQDGLPENSIEPHSSVSMTVSQVIQFSAILQQTISTMVEFQKQAAQQQGK